MGFRFFDQHRPARAIGLAVGGVSVVGAGLATAAALGAAGAPLDNSARISAITGGELTPEAFGRLTAGMDRSMLILASRTEGVRPDTASMLRGAVTPAPAEAEPTVLKLQNLTIDQAEAWNAANPTFKGANPAAKPFKLRTEGVLDEARAVDCLTAAVYYEAAWETKDGQRAVAQVVLNRVRHPAYPKTVCGVVFQGSQRKTGCQFSFTCDGSMNRAPNQAAWDRSRNIAVAALNGYVMKKVGNATHYHADYVAPYWSPSLLKVSTIGAHIFYRWTGGWGQPGAFGGRYAGTETAGVQVAALERPSALEKVEIVQSKADTTIEEPAPLKIEPPIVTAQVAVPSAADAARDAQALVKAEDLDWQGRPKQKGPPRIAMPGM